MEEKLELSLPASARPAPGRGVAALLVALVLLALAQSAWLVWRTPGAGAAGARGTSLDELKALAAKLEDRGLYAAAAGVWNEALAGGNLSPEARARACFNIGKLYQRAERYEDAVAAYYRSEAAQAVPELESEIRRSVVECLERMGQFAGLSREIAARTSLPGAQPAENTVAEIGRTHISAADLDRLIQEDLDRQTDAVTLGLPPDQRNNLRKQLLERFKERRARQEWLERYVVEELLYREALEKKLAETPAMKRLAAFAMKKLLAQQLVMQEVGSRAALTDGDIANAYEANKARYSEPERAEVSHILVREEAEAKNLLERLKKGDKFEELAKSSSTDEVTKAGGGVIKEALSKSGPVPGLGPAPAFSAAVFDTAEGQVVSQPVKSEKGWHVILVRKRIPARQKPLAEVREQVFQELSQSKQREIEQELIEKLKTKYGAVIHMSHFEDTKKEKDAPPAPANMPRTKT